MNNPWENLSRLTQIRINNITNHNLFWFKDALDKYGLLIQCKDGSFSESHIINLKGIQIEIDQEENPNKLLLILRDREDWEIFKVLCNDLINVVADEIDDTAMINEISRRLERWQKLLQYDLKTVFSSQKQKGLFSELIVLKELVVTKYNYVEAVESWKGPLFHKQDFIFENTALEVKSYSSSESKVVKISSKEQLNSPKLNFFLAAVGMSENRRGKNISHLVNDIVKELPESFVNIFNDKLVSYAYIPELIKEPLINFVVDAIDYYKVADNFPKIIPENTAFAINKVEYSIDLGKCGEFSIRQFEVNL